ncbi:tryptophan aminotransferase related 2 [Striga asiatica]|uniref:Tryptophan aminotransferase related 2 n=1 Tax=Striga asiatica TaxID=4170 RepID=A0A5A7PWK7_STRAF|nr:tryptophan aminotransferase related 2 [Striga asiatica]
MCGKLQVVTSKASSVSVPEDRDSNGHHHVPLINLDHGDPTMYESYWKEIGQNLSLEIPGFESLSYFSNPKKLCWFLEPKLEDQIKKVHEKVGNAITENRHIIVGTGSSQLILAALFALSTSVNEPNPVSVICRAPYYSSYPEMSDFLKSKLFEWWGDADLFDKDKNEPYIEMVTSPNNPDGTIRQPIVNGPKGMLVHDLAYYWPQYTAITSSADHDVMLFTVSKCTGHAGSRIGWAVVRDENVARKMVKFIEINTIGVSKEAQLRAANILEMISLSCTQPNTRIPNFFKHSRHLMAQRWTKLREAINNNSLFHVAKFPKQYCNFSGEFVETYPAFAWIKCKDGVDCEKVFKGHKILTRSGVRFGCEAEYVRVSMLSRDDEFELFVKRLPTIHVEDANLN